MTSKIKAEKSVASLKDQIERTLGVSPSGLEVAVVGPQEVPHVNEVAVGNIKDFASRIQGAAPGVNQVGEVGVEPARVKKGNKNKPGA